MKMMKTRSLALVAFSLFAIKGFSLTTIATDEPNYPIAPYLTQTSTVQQANSLAAQIAASNDSFAAQILSKQAPLSTNLQDNIQALSAQIFPFTPVGMTVGTVAPKKVDLHLLYPIFLIGSDQTSIAWIKQYQSRLVQLHAKGFLVQANDMGDVNNMRSLVGDLPLTPLPNTNIGSELGVDHYPVLVSSKLIEQ